MHPHAEGFLAPFLNPYLPWLYHESVWWTVLGLAANATFSGRFVLQWLSSEKAKKVVVPAIFWHLSFWGSVMNLIYSIHLDKVAFILGFCFLPFIYGRNLYMIYRHQPIVSPGDSKGE
jgi:lipid-A-disaccharide synthase-like uncharacterized protein